VLRQAEMTLYPIPVTHTYGYITKNTRIRAGLPKSHAVDALCIAGHPDAARTDEVFFFKQLRRHNRKVMKSNMLPGGRWKRNQAAREVHGFRRYDVVRYKGCSCYVNSLRSRGIFSIRSLDDEIVSNDISYKRLGLIRHSGRSLFHKERGVSTQFPAPAEAGSTLA